jgi:hypothetical protein
MEVDEEQLYTYVQYFAWGLHVVLSAGCRLVARCIGAVCIDDIVLGFQSVEELYPSPPLGVDRADTIAIVVNWTAQGKEFAWTVCREGFFILPYNELAVAQGPKIQQKNKL